jgi:hypothetical protein
MLLSIGHFAASWWFVVFGGVIAVLVAGTLMVWTMFRRGGPKI